MKRQIHVLPATLLACLNALAQQPQAAYGFRATLSPGMTIGGHTFTEDTVIDGVAMNDEGEVVFVSHWFDAGGSEHAGVFASHTLVAGDGEMIDGKLLMRIEGDSLAINGAGQVAYEALYTNDSSPGALCRGVFLEKHFAVALDSNKAGPGPDFTLTDDGKIIPRGGIHLTPPAAPAQTPASAPQKNPGLLDRIHINMPKLPKQFPLSIGSAKQEPKASTQSPAQSQQARPQQAASVAPSPAAQPAAPCSLPTFPLPAEWEVGAEIAGPITSHTFDAPAKGRTYLSPFYGILNAPFRVVQFGIACQPILIAIGDSTARGRFEVWSPAGLVTRQLPDGFYEFKGYTGKVQSASFVRADAMLRVNKRGQLLVPVSLSPRGYALLLGTPFPQ